jgi:dTDP-4-dehydrorhamnose reductase
MKILVLGGSGIVGEKFLEKGNEYKLLATHDKNEIDSNVIKKFQIHLPDDSFKLKKMIIDERPEIILNTMAYSNADFCEENKEKTYELHVKITKMITTVCNEINAKMIFLSSDYVFDGKKGNYQENDMPNPINYYGKTKYEAEKIILENPNNLIIRTSLIYGSSNKIRFLNFVLDNLKKGCEINAYNDIFNSATFVDELVNAILKSIDLNITGILNIVGSTCVSRFEFANAIAKNFNLNQKLIKPISVTVVKLKANRPIKPCLDNTKAKKVLKMKFSTIDEGIKQIFEQKNKKNY